jgi:hypothetical protein
MNPKFVTSEEMDAWDYQNEVDLIEFEIDLTDTFEE